LQGLKKAVAEQKRVLYAMITATHMAMVGLKGNLQITWLNEASNASLACSHAAMFSAT